MDVEFAGSLFYASSHRNCKFRGRRILSPVHIKQPLWKWLQTVRRTMVSGVVFSIEGIVWVRGVIMIDLC